MSEPVDWHEALLLWRAVRACWERDLALDIARNNAGNVYLTAAPYHMPPQSPGVEADGPALADALAALLRDLGETVPERPIAERVAEVDALIYDGDAFWPDMKAGLRDLADREPETVLALIFGGRDG